MKEMAPLIPIIVAACICACFAVIALGLAMLGGIAYLIFRADSCLSCRAGLQLPKDRKAAHIPNPDPDMPTSA